MRPFAAFLLALVLAPPVRADLVPELPGLETLAVDARSAALGGAGVASSEEVGSLVSNPSAIALLRRNEVSVSTLYQRRRLTSSLFTGREEAALNTGELSAAGVVYSIPVYRGALAVGLLYHRASLFDRDLTRSGVHTDGALEDEVLEERGSLDHWTLGSAIQVSPGAFVGGALTLVSGSSRRVSRFRYEPPSDDPHDFAGIDETDLSGLRAALSALYFPSGRVRIGLRVDLPYTVRYEGLQRVEGQAAAARLDDDVTYPMAAAAGVAARAGRFLVTGELEFRPHTLLELNGERLRTDARREGYRDVLVGRLGAEYTADFPMRFRAGYRYDPDPFRLLLAEVREQNPVEAVMEEAEFERERHVVTAGVGLLFESALSVDAALEIFDGKKAGTNVDQADRTTRFILSTSYRF